MPPETVKLWKMTREYVTHAAIGGAVLLLTGFVPEEFLVHLLSDVHVSEGAVHLWSIGIDVRIVAVIVGMCIIVGDLVLRRRTVLGFAGDPVNDSAKGAVPLTEHAATPMPPVRYCATKDGIHLAYAIHGDGPALVYVGHWFGHLTLDWEYPTRRSFFERLGRGRTLLRYDSRGNGLSDRKIDKVSHGTWVSDLETVVDAAGLGRFAVIGLSQTVPVAITYAVRHPERVTHLIVYGGYALGWKHFSAAERDQQIAMNELTRIGWDRDNPAFRQMWTTQFMPSAPKEAFDAFTEVGRRYTTGEAVARHMEAAGDVNIVSELPLVTVPTLVLHARDDQRVPFEASQHIAAEIPGARLVALPGNNHIPLQGDAAYEQMFAEIDRFLRN
jgi:pimeloyl-ACP methyl ester carboxylesterase